MKKIYNRFILVCSLICYSFLLNESPHAEISNGIIKAKLLLPDSKIGYYRGTRFDWSGVIENLEYKGHQYFGQWFKKYDAERAIKGPVEVFDTIGYNDAKVGSKFIKIGVGALLKPTEKSYSPFTRYEIVNPGKWEIKIRKDRVEYNHTLIDETGYSYNYYKTVRLLKGESKLVIEHRLNNIGTRKIETNVFNHNFFIIDNQPTGPDIIIKFPFKVRGTGKGIDTLAEIRGKEIHYLRYLKDNENVHIKVLQGFRNEVEDYDFKIENHKSGAGVRITGDRALEKLAFWSSSTTSCPEPFIHIKVEPGQEFSWKILYTFYELP